MSFTRTLAFRLMLFLGGAFAVSWLAGFLVLDTQVKRIVDRSQSEVYGEKLEGVIRLLDTRVRRLEATGTRETYEEDFKTSALKTLQDLYYQTPESDGYLFVLDGRGKVLLHPRRPRGDTSLVGTELVSRTTIAAAGEFDYRGDDAENRWGIFRSFPAWGWTLVYSIPWEVKYAGLGQVHRELTRVMVVSTVAVLALFFIIISFFTRPIVRLTRAATAMATGDLDHPIETGGTGGTGEVGVLAGSFIRLRDAIRERIGELKTSNEELRREITHREVAEEHLQESAEMLRSTLTSLDDLVFILDQEHRFVDFQQPRKLDALYLPPQLFIGQRFTEISFPAEAREIWLTALRALETKPEVQSFDYHLPMPAGETWYSAKASQRLDSRGQFAGVTVIVRDITDRKNAEKELERQNVELRKLDRMKDELVRNVSHELKTPVAKQAMQLEILHSLLDTGTPLSPVAKVLAVMDASVNRQQQVIRNLLDLSRLESGRREPSLDLVRLDTAIAGIIEEFRALTDEAGLTVTLESESVTIRGDRGFLWHIFSNLISNALKYRRPEGGGRIDLSVSRRGETAVAVVADNGLGMAPEEQQRAFEKFYQASASVEGSGVGLTIAQEMTELLGGRITLHSEGRGRGIEVAVTFPVAPP